MLSRDEYLKLPLEERLIKLDPEQHERAERLFEELITVDLHTHMFGSLDFHFDYELVRQTGITCCFEAVPGIPEDFEDSIKLLGKYLYLVSKEPGLVLATSAGDIRRAKEERRQAFMFQLEPQTVGERLELVDVAYGMGARMMLLTFNTRNYVGDGCAERTDSGLSYFGIALVEKLNELGILIDLSHCGIQTTLDAIKHSKAPVLCNHTGARALYPRCKRLKTDDELKALADKGGVVGVSAIPNQLSGNPEQGIEDVLNHVDYIVKLIGIDHVAIGTDIVFHDQVAAHRSMAKSKPFDLERLGITLAADYMYGIESPLEWKNIIRGLVARGYSDEEIAKIVGGNALRIIEEVVG
jgi:membrane dipeptidase